MAPKVLRYTEALPRHDISQPVAPVWPRIWDRIAPHFRTDWRRVGRIALITLVVVAILLSPTYVPTLWGWHFRFVGTSQGCYSNCAKDGIFPGSLIWVKKAPAYKVGNFISYGYRETYQGQTPEHPNNPAKKEAVENTVHPIRAIGAKGWVYVGGMNAINSDPDHWVPPSAIHGKVVRVISWLPESYWRWVTMGWTLKQDRVIDRQRVFWSFSTLKNILSKKGRERNWMLLRLADPFARPVKLVNGNSVVQDLNNQWLVYRPTWWGGREVACGSGTVLSDGSMMLVLNSGEAVLYDTNRISVCSLKVHESGLWGTDPVWFGGKAFCFGLDGNIWALDKAGAHKLAPAGKANAMVRRGDKLCAGYMDMLLPPPDMLQGEVQIASN